MTATFQLTELLKVAIIRKLTKDLKMSPEYEISMYEEPIMGDIWVILWKNKSKVVEKGFDSHRPLSDMSDYYHHMTSELSNWLKPILNPNLKMFSHVKF